jgi:hypothetical protein
VLPSATPAAVAAEAWMKRRRVVPGGMEEPIFAPGAAARRAKAKTRRTSGIFAAYSAVNVPLAAGTTPHALH